MSQAGGVAEEDYMRRVPGSLPAGPVAFLQPLLLLDLCLKHGGAFSWSAVPVPGVSSGDDSSFPRGGRLQPAFFVERMKDVCSEAEVKVGTLINVLKSTVHLGNSLVLEEAKVDREKEELCRSIQQSFKKLKASLEAVLDQTKAELEKKADSLAKQKKESLAAQKRELQAAQNEVQLMVEFVVHNVDRINDQDLVHIQGELETKMKEEKKLYQRLQQPAVTPDEFLSASSNTLGSVFLQLSPALVKFKVFEHRELCKLFEPSHQQQG